MHRLVAIGLHETLHGMGYLEADITSALLKVGFQYLERAPWYVLAPATMIFLAVLGFNMLGDALRDALDPLSRPR